MSADEDCAAGVNVDRKDLNAAAHLAALPSASRPSTICVKVSLLKESLSHKADEMVHMGLQAGNTTSPSVDGDAKQSATLQHLQASCSAAENHAAVMSHRNHLDGAVVEPLPGQALYESTTGPAKIASMRQSVVPSGTTQVSVGEQHADPPLVDGDRTSLLSGAHLPASLLCFNQDWAALVRIAACTRKIVCVHKHCCAPASGS